MALMPVIFTSGYLQVGLTNRLNNRLRNAHEKSLKLVTEQVAAIKTIASLGREKSLHKAFVADLNDAFKVVLIGTLKTTFVGILCGHSIFDPDELLL